MSVIMTSHGPDYARSRWGGVAKRVLRLGEWLGVRCSNRVIVVAPWIRDGLAQRLGDELVRAKVRVIPNGMPASDDRHDAGVPRRYGLTERGFILAAGRFVPEKGFAELSAAYLQTSQRVPLVIAGAADHKSRFVTRLTEVLDTEPNIRLLGRVPRPDLFSLLSSCSCFMLPSTHEGHPLTLLEAIKADAAIRASDIPAHRDIGLREELYFPTGSVEAMTRAMENVMDGADYRLSALERKTTIRQYSWTEIAVKTDRVYREVFGDSGGIDSGSGT